MSSSNDWDISSSKDIDSWLGMAGSLKKICTRSCCKNFKTKYLPWLDSCHLCFHLHCFNWTEPLFRKSSILQVSPNSVGWEDFVQLKELFFSPCEMHLQRNVAFGALDGSEQKASQCLLLLPPIWSVLHEQLKGFPLHQPGFSSRSDHVGFLVDRVAWGGGCLFLKYLSFPSQFSFSHYSTSINHLIIAI
jgi:hypothetical protein